MSGLLLSGGYRGEGNCFFVKIYYFRINKTSTTKIVVALFIL